MSALIPKHAVPLVGAHRQAHLRQVQFRAQRSVAGQGMYPVAQLLQELSWVGELSQVSSVLDKHKFLVRRLESIEVVLGAVDGREDVALTLEDEKRDREIVAIPPQVEGREFLKQLPH